MLRKHPWCDVFLVFSIVATLAGGLMGMTDLSAANGAPQQAAAAGIALLVVIAPYLLARAIDEIIR